MTENWVASIESLRSTGIAPHRASVGNYGPQNGSVEKYLGMDLCRQLIESTNSPLVSMEVPLRTAYGQNGRCSMQPKPSSLRAQAQ
ncbi:hypothetical protein TNCV_162661 [Trichonephila clavipes]|nr:hypothetical protein TNCV_162661 [Trichonephila clavipes]